MSETPGWKGRRGAQYKKEIGINAILLLAGIEILVKVKRYSIIAG